MNEMIPLTFHINNTYYRNINVNSYASQSLTVHNTGDGGQTMGEELRHVQMSTSTMHEGERSKQQYTRVMRRRAMQ